MLALNQLIFGPKSRDVIAFWLCLDWRTFSDSLVLSIHKSNTTKNESYTQTLSIVIKLIKSQEEVNQWISTGHNAMNESNVMNDGLQDN